MARGSRWSLLFRGEIHGKPNLLRLRIWANRSSKPSKTAEVLGNGSFISIETRRHEGRQGIRNKRHQKTSFLQNMKPQETSKSKQNAKKHSEKNTFLKKKNYTAAQLRQKKSSALPPSVTSGRGVSSRCTASLTCEAQLSSGLCEKMVPSIPFTGTIFSHISRQSDDEKHIFDIEIL